MFPRIMAGIGLQVSTRLPEITGLRVNASIGVVFCHSLEGQA